jgi:hypothetical protein
MDIHTNWPRIRTAFEAGVRSSRHCAIATIGPDGTPHVTPIGFAFARDDFTLYYFEEHPRRLPANLAHNPQVCILAVDRSTRLWGGFLMRGRFASPPGLRLIGVAGARRAASAEEREALRRRIGPLRQLPGAKLIWGHLEHVRDVRIERCEPVTYPGVTEHLWS